MSLVLQIFICIQNCQSTSFSSNPRISSSSPPIAFQKETATFGKRHWLVSNAVVFIYDRNWLFIRIYQIYLICIWMRMIYDEQQYFYGLCGIWWGPGAHIKQFWIYDYDWIKTIIITFSAYFFLSFSGIVSALSEIRLKSFWFIK